MYRKIYGKMLKKGQQKSSTRLYDRVIMRKRVKNECHNHVKKSRVFRKGWTVSELTLTPIRRALTESRFELILRHNPQKLITRVVRKLYPRNTKHIRNNLRCNSNVRTSNASEKMRYWKITSMHVGVKLLDQYEWTCDRDVTQWLPTSTMNDNG